MGVKDRAERVAWVSTPSYTSPRRCFCTGACMNGGKCPVATVNEKPKDGEK